MGYKRKSWIKRYIGMEQEKLSNGTHLKQFRIEICYLLVCLQVTLMVHKAELPAKKD